MHFVKLPSGRLVNIAAISTTSGLDEKGMTVFWNHSDTEGKTTIYCNRLNLIGEDAIALYKYLEKIAIGMSKAWETLNKSQ